MAAFLRLRCNSKFKKGMEALKWMWKNPIKTTTLTTIIASPVINIYLTNKAAKTSAVYHKIERGSNPVVPVNLSPKGVDPVVIQRQSIADITTEIFSEEERKQVAHVLV